MATISRGRIFICYRRRDARDLAGRIYDSLVTQFGEDDIFMDVDAIEPGLDFVQELTKAVASCDVLLAVIGHRWLTITDSAGRRRLDNPADFVRLEIETALQREIRVIPVLTEDATLPRADDLPDSIASLVRRQAVQIRFDRYRDDVSNLISTIKKALGGGRLIKIDRTSEPEPMSNAPSESTKVPGMGIPSSGLGVEGRAAETVEPDLIHVLRHDDTVLRVVFSHDSKLLASASKDETARLWEDGQQRHQLLHSDSVNDIAFSYDDSLLATVTAADDDVRLWNTQTGLLVRRFTANSPNRVLFSPARDLLAAYKVPYGPIYLWEYSLTQDRKNRTLLELDQHIVDLDFGGRDLLAIASSSSARVRNIAFQTDDRLIHRKQVNSVHFSKEGTLLTTASKDGTSRIWDPRTGQEYHRLRHDKEVELALFSPDDSLIATVSGSDVYIWDRKTGYKNRQLQHEDSVQDIQFSPDGELLVTCSANTVQVWRMRYS